MHTLSTGTPHSGANFTSAAGVNLNGGTTNFTNTTAKSYMAYVMIKVDSATAGQTMSVTVGVGPGSATAGSRHFIEYSKSFTTGQVSSKAILGPIFLGATGGEDVVICKLTYTTDTTIDVQAKLVCADVENEIDADLINSATPPSWSDDPNDFAQGTIGNAIKRAASKRR